MYFQVLDNKKDCYGFFYEGALYRNSLPKGATRTWDYSFNLDDINVDLAILYCGGKGLADVCPEHLREDLECASGKLKAFLRSFEIAKVSLEENCFFDLVPDRFLLEYFELKNQITQHVFETHEKPKNYDFLKSLNLLSHRISSQPLTLDNKIVRELSYSSAGRTLAKTIKTGRTSVKYNIFGTRTGRLSTTPQSFPILTLKRELRSALVPQNDWFVELDFNAAELRTFLSLSGTKQPEEDIHEWNARHIYKGDTSRDEAKQKIFAWLYNPEAQDRVLDKAYNREELLLKYWDGHYVKTPFGRKIEADRRHALNYIIQSTTSDVFLNGALKIDELLRGRKSNIAFMLHDAVIIDYSEEDTDIFLELLGAFSQTKLGEFKTNVSAGKQLTQMEKLSWKQ